MRWRQSPTFPCARSSRPRTSSPISPSVSARSSTPTSNAERDMLMTLDGKVALVTGAASGIGHAIARRYVSAGGRVAIADLNLEAAKAAALELGDDKTAIAVAMDVANEEQVNAGVEKTVS